MRHSMLGRACAAVVMTVVALVVAVPVAHAADAGPLDAWTTKRVDIPVTNAVYLPGRNVYLATVDATHPSLGNDLVEISPDTGQVGRHVFVGSKPANLAVSDDGTVAYVGLGEANRIVEVSLTTFTVTDEFGLGADPEWGPVFANDIAVVPGQPDTIVVSLRRLAYPDFYAVVVLHDGDPLPGFITGFYGPTHIEVVDDAHVYGDIDEGGPWEPDFVTMDLSADGVSNATQTHLDDYGADIEPAGSGRLLTTSGKLLDPTGPTVLQTYGGGLVEAEPARNRVDSLDTFGTFEQFDMTTGALIGSRWFQELADAKHLVASRTGYLVVSAGAFYLVGPGVVAGKVVVPPAAPAFGPFLAQRFVALGAHVIGMASDPAHNRVYALARNDDDTSRTELVKVDPLTGAVVGSVWFAGSIVPGSLSISDDGSTAYVGVWSTNEIARFDLATLAETTRFSVGTNGTEVLRPYSVAAVPGTNDSVIAAGQRGDYDHFVARYNNGTRVDLEPDAPVDQVAFASPTELFGVDRTLTSHDLYGLHTDANSVDLTVAYPYPLYGLPFTIHDGVMWTAFADVIDLSSGDLLDKLEYGGAGLPVPEWSRVFQASGSNLLEYDAESLRLIRSTPVIQGGVGDLVTTSAGLAGSTNDGIVLFGVGTCDGRAATVAGTFTTVIGTPGDDVIVGSPGPDYIDGGGGNDVICGMGGNDVIVGGAGNDKIDAGTGDDRMLGGPGDDDLNGNAGTDAVYLGNDAVPHVVDIDGVADDGITGVEHDNIRGGIEIVIGSPGPDTITGNAEGQTLRGMGGDDTLFGGGGDDRLEGGAGDDHLYGGMGRDTCVGGPGSNAYQGCEVRS